MNNEKRNELIAWLILIGIVAVILWEKSSKKITSVTNLAPSAATDLVVDDKLEDKKTSFDPLYVDSRPVTSHDGKKWTLNASAAITRLDIIETNNKDDLLNQLHPSYQSAAEKFRAAGLEVLPSLNLLDAKAKQFDMGLRAAILLATVRTPETEPEAAPNLLKRLLAQLPPKSDAYAWVFAALEAGGYLSPAELSKRPSRALSLLLTFLRSREAKPLSFYHWTPELERLWRFYGFLERPLTDDRGENFFGGPIVDALKKDEALAKDYQRLVNLLACVSSSPEEHALLTDGGTFFLAPLKMYEDALVSRKIESLGVDVMQAFIQEIRSGRVDLKPKKGSGWYDYQIYALETFLLPERGQENQKLLLTRKYKRRLLEAFKALATTRRYSFLSKPKITAGRDPHSVPIVSPALRVEPNPTYYLRMARSYAFLETALPVCISPGVLKNLKGWQEGKTRNQPLMAELAWMKQLFYGLYLISAEDIGMKPDLLPDELPDAAAVKDLAAKYLAQWELDPDLAVDSRISTPVAKDNRNFQLWCVLGVKGIKLEAAYETGPVGRPVDVKTNWSPNRPYPDDDSPSNRPDQLFWESYLPPKPHRYILIVDEFSGVNASAPLDRAEFRALCDQGKTKERILESIAKTVVNQ